MGDKKNKASLDKKSISAIADQLEERMGRSGTRRSRADEDSNKGRRVGKSGFFWGAASGLAVAFAVPLMGKRARPAVKGAIKGGLVAGRYVQRVAATFKEDVQDITAEAKSDMDKENPDGSRTDH